MIIKDYLDQIKKLNNSVYVFGAGHVADILHDVLFEEGIEIKAFLVTDTSHNKSNIKNVEVIPASSMHIDKKAPVLIAVIERGERKIRPYLEALGFTSIVDVPDNILELDSWEYKRARSPIIEVTAKIGCIVNCKYCPQNLLIRRYFEKDKLRKAEMSLEDYKNYLDKCPDNMIVDFSGFVEPFLIEDSVGMMEYTYQTGHEMTLFTTLRGLSVEQAKKVIEMPFRYVCLHMPDKDGYANIPMTEEYFQVLDIFMEATKENGEPFVDIANSQSIAHPLVTERTKGKLKIYCEMSDRAGNLDKDDPALTHVITAGEIYCSRALALNHNVLLPDGSLALCCNDFGLDYIIGNLSYQSYDEIMHGDVMKEIKRAMHIDTEKDLICRKCMFATSI